MFVQETVFRNMIVKHFKSNEYHGEAWLILRQFFLPGTPWGRAWGGSWPESVCSGSPPARAPPGGSSEDWGWAGRSPGATVRRRESTALCCTCTGEHKDQ